MSNQQKKGYDDESSLNISTTEPLELDEQYTKPKTKIWGKCHPLMFRKGQPTIILGPHWPLFICAFLIFFVMSIVMIIIRMNDEATIFYSTILVSINQCLSYLIVALIDPGVANVERQHVEKESPGQNQKSWYCKICKLIQLKETQHCYDCDVCIQGYDHHCPWTGKCIGKGNIKQFYYFILSTIVFMVYNLVQIVLKAKAQESQ